MDRKVLQQQIDAQTVKVRAGEQARALVQQKDEADKWWWTMLSSIEGSLGLMEESQV